MNGILEFRDCITVSFGTFAANCRSRCRCKSRGRGSDCLVLKHRFWEVLEVAGSLLNQLELIDDPFAFYSATFVDRMDGLALNGRPFKEAFVVRWGLSSQMREEVFVENTVLETTAEACTRHGFEITDDGWAFASNVYP